MTGPTRRRSWRPWRFSLGMLLVVVTVFCWWLSHYSARVRHSSAVDKLRAQGVQVFHGRDLITLEDLLYADRTKGGAHWIFTTIFDRRFHQGKSADYFELDQTLRGGVGSQAVDSLVICEPYSHLGRLMRMQAEEDFFLPDEDPSFWDHEIPASELRPIRQLNHLRLVSVTTDFATKPITDELTRCKSIEVLLLDMPELSRTELEQWLRLPRLQTLVLRSVTLRDPALAAAFCRNHSLQQIALVDCEVSSAFTASLEREHPNLVLCHCHEDGAPRHRMWAFREFEPIIRPTAYQGPTAADLDLPLPNVGELPKF